MVFYIMFFVVLIFVWLFLVGAKAHDKVIKKVEKFKNENLKEMTEENPE